MFEISASNALNELFKADTAHNYFAQPAGDALASDMKTTMQWDVMQPVILLKIGQYSIDRSCVESK
jgi:hypothetical protein